MTPFDIENIGWTFGNNLLGISARRLLEHTQMGQINPFSTFNAASAKKPETFVDVVEVSGLARTLTGWTLNDLLQGCHQRYYSSLLHQSLKITGTQDQSH